jgi:hypothetical protein
MPILGTPRRRTIGGAAAVAIVVAGAIVMQEAPRPVLRSTPAPLEDFRDGFEGDGAGAPLPDPPVTTLCEDPLIQPAGWTRSQFTWERAWSAPNCFQFGKPCYALAVWPASIGVPVPLGASRGGYRTIPFVPEPAQTVGISWDKVQANPLIGYGKPRPADGIWMSVSPCAGDFRPGNDAASDHYLRRGCRRGAAIGGLIWSTTIAESTFQACALVAGQTYYLNVIAANPEDGLTEGENTCTAGPNTGDGCDVLATHRPQ